MINIFRADFFTFSSKIEMNNLSISNIDSNFKEFNPELSFSQCCEQEDTYLFQSFETAKNFANKKKIIYEIGMVIRITEYQLSEKQAQEALLRMSLNIKPIKIWFYLKNKNIENANNLNFLTSKIVSFV